MIRAVTSSRSIRLLRSKKRVQKEERSCFARSDLASQISSLSESAAKEKPEIVRFKSVQGEALLAFFAFIPKSLSWLRFSGRIGHHRRSSAPTSQNLGRQHRVPADRLTTRKIGAFCVLESVRARMSVALVRAVRRRLNTSRWTALPLVTELICICCVL
jgi:hypothetical protein